MAQIIVMQVPGEMSDREYDCLMSQVSEMRREQVGRFVRQKDAYRSLLGECLIRKAARSQLGIANKDIAFSKNQYGKPSLRGADSFFYNVSHSGEWVVLFWGRGEVGVDVEQVKTIDLGIAERFFRQLNMRICLIEA